jgi:outer membrane lipoprotein LolB
MTRPRDASRAALSAVLLTALLSGCAALPPPPPPPDVVAIERRVAAAFELEGRVSATDGEQAASGRIHWRHAPAADEWTMFSPLGQVIAQLVSSPAGAHLQTADGRQISAPDAQAMLPELLGVAVPIEGLRYWVQGAARPGARVLSRDPLGRPARITDAGWIIDYTDYAAPGADAPPRRIDAHWGEARVRLVIDTWTPLP